MNIDNSRKYECLCCKKQINKGFNCCRCMNAIYCSPACQRQHWTHIHKKICYDINIDDETCEKLESEAKQYLLLGNS